MKNNNNNNTVCKLKTAVFIIQKYDWGGGMSWLPDNVLHGGEPLLHGEAQPSHAEDVGEQAVPEYPHGSFTIHRPCGICNYLNAILTICLNNSYNTYC